MADLIDREELLEEFYKQGIDDKGAIDAVRLAFRVHACTVVVCKKCIHGKDQTFQQAIPLSMQENPLEKD